MLIGLVGKKRSGKDTVYSYINEFVPAYRMAFADPLKESVCELLGISREGLEILKEQTEIRIGLNIEPKFNPEIQILNLNMREFLQRYGTEAHRNVFGTNFWVDAVLPDDFYHEDYMCVVTDCRFDNEVNRIRYLGGKIVKVERPSVVTTDIHASEAMELSDSVIDYKIINDGDLEHLKHKVYEMLESFGSV